MSRIVTFKFVFPDEGPDDEGPTVSDAEFPALVGRMWSAAVAPAVDPFTSEELFQVAASDVKESD